MLQKTVSKTVSLQTGRLNTKQNIWKSNQAKMGMTKKKNWYMFFINFLTSLPKFHFLRGKW